MPVLFTWLGLFLSTPPGGTLGNLELILEWDGMHETVITAEEIRRQCDLVLLRKDLEKTVRAKVYLRRGDAALALKDYATADLSFQEASKLLPGDRECLWKIGLAKVKTPSEREESLKIANKIIKEYPNYAPGFYLAGLFYLEMNNYLKAFEYLNKTIELDNTFTHAFLQRAAACYHNKEYHKCLADVETALSLPQMAGAPGGLYFLRGSALFRLDKFSEANTAFLHVQQLGIRYKDLYFLYWVSLNEDRKFAAALALSEKITQLLPQMEETHWIRSRSLVQFGFLEEAEKEAQMAIIINPKSVFGLISLAIVNENKKNYFGAVQAYFKTFAFAEHGEAYLRLAFLAATCPDEKFRDRKTALKFAEGCLKASGTTTNKRASMIVLALAQAEAGEHQKAVQTVVQAAKIGTPHPEVVQSCQKLAALFRQGKAYRHDPTKKKEQIFSLDPAIPFFGHH